MTDLDYTGVVAVVFINFSNRVFEIKKGQRFAQITFQKISLPTLRELPPFNDRTERNLGAFCFSGAECLRKF